MRQSRKKSIESTPEAIMVVVMLFLVFLLQISSRNAVVLGLVSSGAAGQRSHPLILSQKIHCDAPKLNPSSETRSKYSPLWKSKGTLPLVHFASNQEEADTLSPVPNLSVNVIPLVVWIGLIVLSFFNNGIVPHGLPVEQLDQEILQSIIENPVHPANLNELYYTLFNVFGPLPLILSALILPQEELRGKFRTSDSAFVPPPQPFLFGSAVLGFFVLGIYMTLRPQLFVSTDNVECADEEWSWFTRNLWENRVFHAFILLFLFYLPFGTNTLSAIHEQGWSNVYQDFQHLLATSRFAAISCMDLFLCHMTSVSFIPSDYAIRTARLSEVNDDDEIQQVPLRGNVFALLAALVPFVGPAVYIAVRPSLVEKK